MISRRDFGVSLLGAASVACFGLRPGLAQQSREFICGTIDRLPGTAFILETKQAKAAPTSSNSTTTDEISI